MTEQDRSDLKGIPLSISQERLWFLDQLHRGNAAQNLACGLCFTGLIDRAALNCAVDEVVQRYEILRTEFHSMDGSPLQVVLSPVRVTVRAVDLGHVAPDAQKAELLRLAQSEAQSPFDLTRGPLLRATIFQLSDTQHVFVLVIHRIVCDGASLKLVLSEVSSRYQARLNGESLELADTPIQYREFAARNAAPSAAQISYWKQQLKGVPATIDLPVDRQRPLVQTFRGDKQRMWIEPGRLERLRQVGQRHGTDLFTTLLAAFNVLLFRYSRQDDIVVGTRVSGRTPGGLEKLIGSLENMLALRTDVSGDPIFADLLVRVREVTQAGFSHQEVPFGTLAKELRLERDMSRHPLFQIIFTIQDAAVAGRTATQPGVTLFEFENPAEEFDLSVEFATKENGLEATFGYNPELFDRATIGRMMGHFRKLLDSGAENPSIKISRMPLLSETERQQLLVEWNVAGIEDPAVPCVHECFEEQVERTPNAVAVSYKNLPLTYSELNQRANQLAHYLRNLGVGPDSRVGICLERGFEMLVGLLAVLKAGGAYVPLDPAYPRERLHFMLHDSAPAVLLTQRHLRGLFTGISEELPVLDVVTGRAWDVEPATNPDRVSIGLTPQNLAYVIYTSGSTGAPKGVMVEHENVARLFTSTDAWFHFNANDVWTLFHSYAFDFSVWEIWGALFYGGRLVIVPKDVTRSPEDFYELMCRERVTILNQTPSAFRQLITAQGKSSKSHQLRHVIFGGEALEVAMLKPWYEQNSTDITQLINMYGITETTVHVTYRPLAPGLIPRGAEAVRLAVVFPIFGSTSWTVSGNRCRSGWRGSCTLAELGWRGGI